MAHAAHSDSQPPDQCLTVEDIALIFKVPTETVYQWRKKRTGPPGFRVGRYVRYDPAEVAQYIKERTTHDASAA